jgi:hypothetical protein
MLVMLDEKLNEGMSLEDFFKDYLGFTPIDLISFPHKTILAALKKYPDGVNPGYFGKQKS